MISAFHSVVVDVRAFDVGVRDYSRLLGQLPARIESNSQGGTRSAYFGLENMTLEIRAHEEEGPAEATSVLSEGGAGFGLSGIRLSCDLDDPAAFLTGRGLGCAPTLMQTGTTQGALAPRSWRTDRIDPESSCGTPVEVVSHESAPAAPDLHLSPGEVSTLLGGNWAEVDPAAQVRRLDHVVVLSPDPEATRAFYEEGLALRLALDKSFADRGVRLLFFRVGGTTLEIGSRLGADPRPDDHDRFGGLAWQVGDIEAVHSRLAAEGFDVSEIRVGHKPGTRVCTARDPVHAVPTLLIEPVAGP